MYYCQEFDRQEFLATAFPISNLQIDDIYEAEIKRDNMKTRKWEKIISHCQYCNAKIKVAGYPIKNMPARIEYYHIKRRNDRLMHCNRTKETESI